jgi:2-dehydro-3-deoxyphosphogluconate aldolase / (4S)-4-hydroxy-2-oxoglutarate aldolase
LNQVSSFQLFNPSTNMSRFSPATLHQKLDAAPVVPLLSGDEEAFVLRMLSAAYAGGVRVFEFTNRSAKAFDIFKVLAKMVEKDCPDLALGIGTIFEPEDARRFLDVGADFIIQPVMTPAVGEVCREYGVDWMPGALTPSEIYAAIKAGAEIVKLFPGNAVGPGYVKAILAPMPKAKIMVTGGVEPNEANLRSWFSAGAKYVGMGSQLFKDANQKSTAQLSQEMADLLALVKNIQASL